MIEKKKLEEKQFAQEIHSKAPLVKKENALAKNKNEKKVSPLHQQIWYAS